ncbi:phage tail protein [Pseudomonas ovata]|uniref:phage tail-collar fiber domain-containing protein n=1 Tax=Pseudomonas ovata TaxID=1839709 RepID=UPI000D68E08A|nr:phage tail protein [Pseudomonas ovata]
MSTPLQPVITKTGLAAIFTADNTGVSARIGSIVLGTSSYTPSADQKSLVTQVAEYPIADGERLSSTMLHITALADGPHAFWVREIGFKLTDGTLLAVWSHPTEALTYKAANASILLAYDLSLSALPADSVTIVSSGAGLSLSLAGPLAAQATAMLAEQLRGLRQQELLNSHARQHFAANGQLESLTERMRLAEGRQDTDKADLAEQGAALATALFHELLRGVRQQDTLGEHARLHQVEGQQIASLTDRMKAGELRQDADRDGLLAAIAVNAAGLIALQTLFVKTL